MSVRDYHNAVRVVAALEQLPNDKIDSVARHVGWRSTKNLLRAVHRVTGLTPTAFRALSLEQAADLLQFVKATLARTSRERLRGTTHPPTR